jgi:hypothetical protein
MPDYIPSSDGDFLTWEQNFLTYAAAHLEELGLLAADLGPVATAATTWETSRTDAETKQTALSAAVSLKATDREAAESEFRGLVRRLQASPVVSDDERRALRITVKDGDPTPVGPTATRPLAVINTAERFRHQIKFVDAGTPARRGKPAGVIGCEVWCKIGEPPTGPSQMTFLGLSRSSPYLAEFPETDAGKMAHYMLRWVANSGEKGPWSETAAATITG